MFHLNTRKNFFWTENQEQLLQGCGRVLIAEGFQTVVEKVVRQSYPGSLFHKKLNWMIS